MTELEMYMRKKGLAFVLIHCKEQWQVKKLVEEIEVPKGSTKENALNGWKKYQQEACYGVMGEPLFQRPTLLFYCSRQEKAAAGERIVSYEEVWQQG